MGKCSFCGEHATLRAGGMRLCPDCRDQLVQLSPESPAYLWYMRAVRRAMDIRRVPDAVPLWPASTAQTAPQAGQ